jgi:hypothetical protein
VQTRRDIKKPFLTVVQKGLPGAGCIFFSSRSEAFPAVWFNHRAYGFQAVRQAGG